MTAKPYELLARFSSDGSVAGASVRTITTVDGKDYISDPQPLDGATDAAFVSFADSFSAGVVSERDTLTTERNELASQVSTLTSERDSLKAELDRVRPPHDPRLIDPNSFKSRINDDELFAVIALATSDPIAAGFFRALKDARDLRKADKAYQMSLDHENTQQGIAYLAASGVFTEQRAAAMLADAREDES